MHESKINGHRIMVFHFEGMFESDGDPYLLEPSDFPTLQDIEGGN